jgi:putative oxidoreductase
MHRFLSPEPLWQQQGLGILRIIVGLFMVYHGLEVFDENKMNEYTKWMVDMKLPAPAFMAYLGKSSELITGILLTIGLFTRPAAIVLAITMTFIAFGIGHGRIHMEDQHPFLFVLLALVFIFTGPGKWSLDRSLFGRRLVKV